MVPRVTEQVVPTWLGTLAGSLDIAEGCGPPQAGTTFHLIPRVHRMTTLKLQNEEVAEIERHKYFLSEKAGYDVGWEFAEQDWLAHHAEQFRSSSKSPSPSSDSGGIKVYFKRLLAKAGVL
jgi:hypothetical protein